MWLQASQQHVSKGLLAPKARRLADLHARRALTESQYFTPEWVAVGIWAAMEGVVSRAGHRLAVVDSSVGSGRLLHPAPVEACRFYGLDTDGAAIDALCDAAEEAGAVFEFRRGRLENAKLANFDIAVINRRFLECFRVV